jgi:hypothetical protein
MKDFIAAEWQPVFEHNGMHSFEDFWKLDATWLEEPNKGRGGWSGVARCELNLPGGGTTPVFLKRQENFVTRTWRHPIRGLPTFAREFRNIVLYQRCAIPSLTTLYFACRQQDGKLRAILITEELAGFLSLEELEREWQRSRPGAQVRHLVIRSVAALLRQIHSHQLRHNCFYPKHIFLRIAPGGQIESRVIDLEKTKWRPFGLNRGWQELATLNRHARGWSRTERLRFFKEYWQVNKLNPRLERIWYKLERRLQRKHPDDAARLSRNATTHR